MWQLGFRRYLIGTRFRLVNYRHIGAIKMNQWPIVLLLMKCLMERRVQSCCALSLVTIYYLEKNEIIRVIVVLPCNMAIGHCPMTLHGHFNKNRVIRLMASSHDRFCNFCCNVKLLKFDWGPILLFCCYFTKQCTIILRL